METGIVAPTAAVQQKFEPITFLHTATVTIVCFLLSRFGCIFIPAALIVVLLITQQWLVIQGYLGWLWKWDRQKPEEGGRRIPFLSELPIWQWFVNYFPINVIQEGKLEKNKHYLFISYPYGTFPYGMIALNALCKNNFKDVFADHEPHLLMSKTLFYSPVYRDIIMGLGMCANSTKSVKNILCNQKLGKSDSIAIVMGGGPEEALNAHPGKYTVFLKNRADFIQVAIQLGVSIVPVFSFGEVDIFKQLANPVGSVLRNIQTIILKTFKIAAIIPGQIVPTRTPVNIVVGKPIEIAQVEDPFPETVEEVQQQFTEALIELFDKNKALYLKNPDIQLNIV